MILMYVSVSDRKQGETIAREIVQKRLANHINFLPENTSLTWENGEIKTVEETILLIKTKALLYSQIEKLIKSSSNATINKIFSVPITQIDFEYHDYLREDIVKV